MRRSKRTLTDMLRRDIAASPDDAPDDIDLRVVIYREDELSRLDELSALLDSGEYSRV